ncbi:MAG: FCD domain-containing protein, partial [Actinomycetes bacterium]
MTRRIDLNADLGEGVTDDEALQELHALADELVRTARENDPVGHSAADLEFHLKLLSLAGNRSLVDVVH